MKLVNTFIIILISTASLSAQSRLRPAMSVYDIPPYRTSVSAGGLAEGIEFRYVVSPSYVHEFQCTVQLTESRILSFEKRSLSGAATENGYTQCTLSAQAAAGLKRLIKSAVLSARFVEDSFDLVDAPSHTFTVNMPYRGSLTGQSYTIDKGTNIDKLVTIIGQIIEQMKDTVDPTTAIDFAPELQKQINVLTRKFEKML